MMSLTNLKKDITLVDPQDLHLMTNRKDDLIDFPSTLQAIEEFTVEMNKIERKTRTKNFILKNPKKSTNPIIFFPSTTFPK
jgi:hypothetical protein